MFDTDEEEVVTFFEKNKDNAYTTHQIADALGHQTPKASEWLIRILLKFEKEGQIERKKIDDNDYWLLATE